MRRFGLAVEPPGQQPHGRLAPPQRLAQPSLGSPRLGPAASATAPAAPRPAPGATPAGRAARARPSPGPPGRPASAPRGPGPRPPSGLPTPFPRCPEPVEVEPLQQQARCFFCRARAGPTGAGSPPPVRWLQRSAPSALVPWPWPPRAPGRPRAKPRRWQPAPTVRRQLAAAPASAQRGPPTSARCRKPGGCPRRRGHTAPGLPARPPPPWPRRSSARRRRRLLDSQRRRSQETHRHQAAAAAIAPPAMMAPAAATVATVAAWPLQPDPATATAGRGQPHTAVRPPVLPLGTVAP
mmetsp:Transcript_98668/g.193858  ORF Transcript_98668/g.193858 Transcript_98668/m.193858 type:complete len:295 (-) Transcript_98668:106-990(-)